MKSSELMARAEHALRTGQTEHLFPVLARRALEVIEEERQANRREWAALVPSKRFEFAIDVLSGAFSSIGRAAEAAAASFLKLAYGAQDQRQPDFALVGPRGVTR